MTAANISFSVPTASSLPNLSASQATSASVPNGEQSFSRVLQSRENAAPNDQPSQANQAKAGNDTNTAAADTTTTQPADNQQQTESAATGTPQEAAEKAAQLPQPGLPKPSPKTGAVVAELVGDSSSTEPESESALQTQPDAGLLAAMAAANMAAQPASTAGKALPAGVTGTETRGQTDSTGLFPEGMATEDATDLKSLFELAAATETTGKPELGATRGKETGFNTALNSAISNQGGDLSTATPLGSSMPQVTTPTSTASRQVVSTPVATQGWAEDVGHKVSWAASNGNGRAELILTPAHMGRIEVSINLNGDQASANFVAANAATREALQDAMPQLRNVLADAGIQLGQANVSANSGGQAWTGTSGQSGFNGSSYNTGSDATADVTVDTLTGRGQGAWILSGNGLVDTFA